MRMRRSAAHVAPTYSQRNANQSGGTVAMARYCTFAQRSFSDRAGVRPWKALVTHQSAMAAISQTKAGAPGAVARR